MSTTPEPSREQQRPGVVSSWRRLGHALAPLAVLGLLVVVDFPLCPTRFLLGLPCPGCGLTRSTLSLLRGDLHAAHAFHPLVLVIMPIAAWVLVRMTLVSAGVLASGSYDPLSRAPRWAWWVFAVVLVGVWAVRLGGGLGGHPDGIHFEDGLIVRGIAAIGALLGG